MLSLTLNYGLAPGEFKLHSFHSKDILPCSPHPLENAVNISSAFVSRKCTHLSCQLTLEVPGWPE